MSQQLNAYVPESLMTEKKHRRPVRICHEDLMAVDPSDGFRILVFRGTRRAVGKSLDAVYGLSSSEMDFLRDSLTKHKRVLLRGDDCRAVLIFGELLGAAGILTVVSPHTSADAIARLFRHMGRSDFAVTPTLSGNSATLHVGDAEVYEQLNELFFYLDRIFSPASRFGLRTRTHLIANFAGCVLNDVAVPFDSLNCSEAEQDRLIAFLLCAFLSLRPHDGGVSARTDTAADAPTLCYRIEPIRQQDVPYTATREFPFLSLPTFRRFAMLSFGGDMPVLEAYLNLSSDRRTVDSAPLRLIGLRFVPCC